MSELSLAAALRDVDARAPDARNLALRTLAPALLEALGSVPPAWWADTEHPRRGDVIAALEQGCADAAPQNAALACIGLAELGAPSAIEHARELLASEGEQDAEMFARECGVISLSLLGASAREVLQRPDPGDQAKLARAARAELLVELRRLLDSPYPDVRYQAAPALVEVGEQEVEDELVASLAGETHERVRANLIAALSLLDPPGPAACDALAAALAGPDGAGEVGWEAALALTAARRTEGGPRLITALRTRDFRDRALEALAMLGEAAPANAAEAIAKYSRGFFVPVFTRVRAAYALARIEPSKGHALLERYAKHPRPAVREAVAEARANLEQLAASPAPADDRYRAPS